MYGRIIEPHFLLEGTAGGHVVKHDEGTWGLVQLALNTP